MNVFVRALALWAASLLLGVGSLSGAYLDNETLYFNQDPNTETRRSEHFRLCFGHFNRDTGTPMTEQLAQGNLQMFEQMWNRWVVELGLNDINESVTRPDGNKYRANFNFLMTWNDGGGGGAYSSMDGNGFFYAMANSGYCRFDPPSGATPHEFGHVWEGTCAGFNGSDSSGAWWECTANWMQLQFLNTYPQAGAYVYNPMYYPAHGRDYYDSFMIWEAAREDSRYGAQWVNNVWTNANDTQRKSEYIIDRMIRCDSSGSPDKPGAIGDLWGDMAKKLVTWDYERQRWLATVNRPDDGSDWSFYQRCRTPMVGVPGSPGWYRPARAHLPMQFGFNIIPLALTGGATVTCNFQPLCDPVRQSDWRACLVLVNTAGEASYSRLWNAGANSIVRSGDQSRCYLVVIATPRPMKIPEPAWRAYLTDAGLQFPYQVSFTNAEPANVVYPRAGGLVQHPNGRGWKATTAIVDDTAYIGPNAQVLNTAQVRGFARIEDYAVVRNNAQVRDDAVVSGHAVVQDNAKVYGNAKVRDWARVFGHAEVYENAKVIEHANCGDGNASTHTKVFGNAIVKGSTYVYDPSTFGGCLIVEGDSANGNGSGTPAVKGVHFGWAWGQDQGRFNSLPDNSYLFARHTFEVDNAVFAMDQFGINHGFLAGGCRVARDTVAPVRGGLVLPLDGTGQHVELHPGVSDFADATYAVWFKLNGGAPGQRLWSMGDGAAKVMYLTPNDSAGGTLKFAISDGSVSEELDGGAIVPNTWNHAAVVFANSGCTLYLNGTAVASNPLLGLSPDQLHAPLMENANYLGRGNAGGFFNGSMDDFRVYMRALNAGEIAGLYAEAAPAPVSVTPDTAPPSPNPTWLVPPTSLGDNAVTMSATPGTDASGWVEYYFDCLSGPGHDSGWVSFNKYTDVGLTPGVPVTYAVRMRDRNGNTTPDSQASTATGAVAALPPAAFVYGPVGIANGQITMTAVKPAAPLAKIEYKFDRLSPSPSSSGWQSSPNWTQSGLPTGQACTYTVTMRDGWGNLSASSSAAGATARDEAPPRLPMTLAHWEMQPYATIDNKVSMTAMAPTDAAGIEYQFNCVSGGGPDSQWQSSRTFLTPVLPDGTYVYRYQTRDTSAQRNVSGYSREYAASITPTSGYHACTLNQALTSPDDYLVSFPATVLRAYSNNYYVKDLASGAAIKVRPSTSNQVTDASLVLKNVQVKGHLYTFAGQREVTFATVTSSGNPALYNVSGRVTNSAGVGIAGATVYFADVPNAFSNAVVTAVTDANGNYSRGVLAGTWHVAAGAAAYNTSADRIVTVAGAAVSGVDFGLAANSRVSGRVTRRADGAPVPGAQVFFSRSPGAASNPTFTAVTDSGGGYVQPVQDGVWHVAAGGAGYYTTVDKMVTVQGIDVGNIDFALRSSARDIPRPSDLLFSAVTDVFPVSGGTGPWPTYQPAGQTFTTQGSPTVETLNGVKWGKYVYEEGDGFRYSRFDSPVPISGASIVVAARPLRNSAGTSWTSLVDIFYQRLVLGIRNSTGKVEVWRNRDHYVSNGSIPSGQATILSLVVQPAGQFKVYANGAVILETSATKDMTSLNPDFTADWGNNPDFTHYMNVGRNDPDGWTTFNGNIGDVFVYKLALTEAERLRIEADLRAKFISTDYTITASAGAGGYINPGGSVAVAPGGSQTFAITASPGFALSNVWVNGVSQGKISSYTFSNVNGNQTLNAAFAFAPVVGPVLSIGPNGSGGFEVSWPDTHPGQLLLSESLDTGATWTPSGVTPVLSGGRYRVAISPGPGPAFYRWSN